MCNSMEEDSVNDTSHHDLLERFCHFASKGAPWENGGLCMHMQLCMKQAFSDVPLEGLLPVESLLPPGCSAMYISTI
jgi:hypothetical protein